MIHVPFLLCLRTAELEAQNLEPVCILSAERLVPQTLGHKVLQNSLGLDKVNFDTQHATASVQKEADKSS